MMQMNKPVYSFSMIKNFYYLYYPFNIKQLLSENVGFSYKFLTISEVKLANPDFGSNFLYDDNKYLNSVNDNKIKLAADILKNGTFWPMFMTKDGYVEEGQHRLYSLKKYNEEVSPVKRKFLFIEISHYFSTEKNMINYLTNIDYQNPKNIYALDNNYNFFIRQTISPTDIENECFKISSGFLNSLIFEINKKSPNYIKPNPIFNDEKLFEKYLKDEL